MQNVTVAVPNVAPVRRHEAHRLARPGLTLTALGLCILMPSLDTSIANAALPTLADAFDASFDEVRWIVLAYLVSITTLIVAAGRLGDVLGRRSVMLFGAGLFTSASLLCALSPTLGTLIAARAVQGAGAAIMMALAVAFVGDTVPNAQTGRAMGVLGTMSAVGTTLGPALGGLLIAGLGSGALFLVNVPVGVLTIALLYRHLPHDQMTAAMLRRVQNGVGDLVPSTLFRNTSLVASLTMNTLVSSVMMATLVVGPFYLSRALGLPAVSAGFVLAAGPFVSGLTGIPAGRIVDRIGSHRATLAGLVGLTSGALIVARVPMKMGVVGYMTPIVIMTASYALFQAANNTAAMSRINVDQRGVAAGMLQLSRYLGLIAGASALGAVFSAGVATTDMRSASPDAIASGTRLTFAVAAGLLGVAMAVFAGGRTFFDRQSR